MAPWAEIKANNRIKILDGVAQQRSISQMRVLRARIGRCGTPLAFGEISIFLPRVRRNAATAGFAVEPVPG